MEIWRGDDLEMRERRISTEDLLGSPDVIDWMDAYK